MAPATAKRLAERSLALRARDPPSLSKVTGFSRGSPQDVRDDTVREEILAEDTRRDEGTRLVADVATSQDMLPASDLCGSEVPDAGIQPSKMQTREEVIRLQNDRRVSSWVIILVHRDPLRHIL